MTDISTQDAKFGKRTAPPELILNEARRHRSSGILIPPTSTGTPASFKIWPSTPTKIQKPTSDNLLFQRAVAELTVEEKERKVANARVVEKNAEIEVTSFNDSTGANEGIGLMAGRVWKKAEMDELFSRTYDEFRPPVDVEQGNFALRSEERSKEADTKSNCKITSPTNDSAKAGTIPNTKSSESEFVPVDPCEGIVPVFPSIPFGAKEVVPLSKIGRADREVKIWEEAVRTYEKNMPSVVPVGKVQLRKAQEARAALDGSLEENTRIGSSDATQEAISQRISALEWGNSTSKFPPEKQNIIAAIAAYKSGLVQLLGHYTIFYAGKVVDTAPDYAAFIHDRSTRLDKYAADYGPGWLWYEPPLLIHPETRIRASLGVSLTRDPSCHMLAPYFLNQGYWKRSGFVQRCASSANFGLAPQDLSFQRDAERKLWCQEDGPPLSFRAMLDSGATFPSLHTADLERLGIDMFQYGAQSIDTLTTAGGIIQCRVFELVVCVLDDGCHQLVKSDDPVWPQSFKYLGGITPVIEFTDPISVDAMGLEQSNRLSGLLPFLACYVASTPTRSVLHLGEDRNDVLGHQRMPGQRKWAVDTKPLGPSSDSSAMWGDPKITFTHRKGVMLDIDDDEVPHKSIITIKLQDGTTFEEISHPKEMQEKWLKDGKQSTAPLVPGNDPSAPFMEESGKAL